MLKFEAEQPAKDVNLPFLYESTVTLLGLMLNNKE